MCATTLRPACGFALIAFAFLLGAAPARAARPPAAAGPAKPTVPGKQMAAAAERWKMKKAVERLKKPGAAGQQDLFWEIVYLWEKQEKARADKDLVAVMNWLLFHAGLYGQADISHAVFTKLPKLVPELGDRILDQRMANWLPRIGTRSSGSEPWIWQHYHSVEKKALAAAVRRAIEKAPKHNPAVRLWLAGALVAADAPEGPKKLAAAREQLRKDMPHKAREIESALESSMAGAGVRCMLPMLLDRAEAEIAKSKFSGSWYWSRLRAFNSFYRLLGWSVRTPRGYPNRATVIAECRAWLRANLDKLKWDPVRKHFVGGAPQPGTGAFMKSSAAVLKKFGFDCTKKLGPQGLSSTALSELAAVMEKSTRASRDPDVAELAMLIVEATRPYKSSRTGALAMVSLPKLNPKLGARIWALALKAGLPPRGDLPPSTLMRNSPGYDPDVLDAAYALLATEFSKEYKVAAKGKDAGAKLDAAMKYLFAGGKLDGKEVNALIKAAPPTWTVQGASSTLGKWQRVLKESGRPACLRLMLIQGEKSIDSYRTRGPYHPIREFQHLAGWRSRTEMPPGTAAEELAKCRAWLDKYEAMLKWDLKRQRFTGAPLPKVASLLRSAVDIKARYGLDAEKELARGRSGARSLLTKIVELMQKNPKAAKDPELVEMTVKMIQQCHLTYDSDPTVRRHIYTTLPGLNTDLGGRMYAATLERRLKGRGVMMYMRPTRPGMGPPGPSPEVRKKAFALVLPKMKKSYEEAKKLKLPISDKLHRALAYLYVGGRIGRAEVDGLLKATIKPGRPVSSLFLTYGLGIAHAGNSEGLHLILSCAQHNRPARAYCLRTFEYAVSKTELKHPKMRVPDRELMKKVDYWGEWFKANQKNLVFDPAKRRYKIKGKEILPPKPEEKPKQGEVF